MERIAEARTFLQSFANTDAREFVKAMLKHNYAQAILMHHPQREMLDGTLVEQQCAHLVDTTFGRITAVAEQPGLLFSTFYQLSRGNSQPDDIWFAAFSEAYRRYRHQHKMKQRYLTLRPFLKGSRYADIGCGGGDTVAVIKREHTDFSVAAGIDVIDWRTEDLKNEIGFQMLDFSQPDTYSKQAYDTITCLAVLHHVGNTDQEQGIFLQNLHRSLAAEGRLIMEEDVILPEEELVSEPSFMQQIRELKKAQPILSEFLEQPAVTQRDSIILIDFLANVLAVGVPEMAFPCGFRTLKDWQRIFTAHGFAISEIKIVGFVKGNFNQSSHVYFVLDKA